MDEKESLREVIQSRLRLKSTEIIYHPSFRRRNNLVMFQMAMIMGEYQVAEWIRGRDEVGCIIYFESSVIMRQGISVNVSVDVSRIMRLIAGDYFTTIKKIGLTYENITKISRADKTTPISIRLYKGTIKRGTHYAKCDKEEVETEGFLGLDVSNTEFVHVDRFVKILDSSDVTRLLIDLSLAKINYAKENVAICLLAFFCHRTPSAEPDSRVNEVIDQGRILEVVEQARSFRFEHRQPTVADFQHLKYNLTVESRENILKTIDKTLMINIYQVNVHNLNVEETNGLIDLIIGNNGSIGQYRLLCYLELIGKIDDKNKDMLKDFRDNTEKEVKKINNKQE